jgi:hypothetical protein
MSQHDLLVKSYNRLSNLFYDLDALIPFNSCGLTHLHTRGVQALTAIAATLALPLIAIVGILLSLWQAVSPFQYRYQYCRVDTLTDLKAVGILIVSSLVGAVVWPKWGDDFYKHFNEE